VTEGKRQRGEPKGKRQGGVSERKRQRGRDRGEETKEKRLRRRDRWERHTRDGWKETGTVREIEVKRQRGET
jgi:hypothetical protein